MTNKENGRRALIWVRVNAAGADRSLAEQEEIIRRVAQEHGLEIVGTVGGVFSAGDEAAVRSRVEEVLARKRSLNDFSTVVVADLTRFSRLRPTATFAIEAQLRSEGVELVSVHERLGRRITHNGGTGDSFSLANGFSERTKASVPLRAEGFADGCAAGAPSHERDHRDCRGNGEAVSTGEERK